MSVFIVLAVCFGLITDAHAHRIVRVRAGETLHSLAVRTGASLVDLIRMNPQLDDPSRLRIGEPVRVPNRPRRAPAAPTPAPSPAQSILDVHDVEPSDSPADAAPDCQAPLLFADQVGSLFADQVRDIAERLQVDPNHLMTVMHFETGGTFRPSIRNPRTRAVGLIQFLPRTAHALGTTDRRLSRLSRLEQLIWVERYLTPFAGLMNTLEETYLAVYMPAAVGEPDEHILFERGSRTYFRNRELDRDSDGIVQRREVTQTLRERLAEGLARLPERPICP